MLELDVPDSCSFILAFLGLLFVPSVLWKFVRLARFFKLHFFTKVNLKARYRNAGEWAVVTGASDGIGKGFSLELAKRGLNVVLISRSKDKLDQVAEEVEEAGVKSLVIPFDFSTASLYHYTKLFQALNHLTIAILVNNVGMCTEYPMQYETVDIDDQLRTLKVNCEPQVWLTHYVLPKMKESRCGAIINMSSIASVLGSPLLSMYGATKAFNRQLSRSIEGEAHAKNIDIISACPSLVISNMSKKRKEDLITISTEKFARSVLNQLGSVTNTYGHWKHCVLGYVYSLLPYNFVTKRRLVKFLAWQKMEIAKQKERLKGWYY